MNTGVYCIRNLFDGKEYVGSAARSFKARWYLHISLLRRKKHPNYLLQAAWDFCGESGFSFDILEECPIEKCIEKEQEWIDALVPEYNICRIAAGSPMAGRNLSPEHKAKISLAMQGIKNPFFGRKHSPESLAKMSTALTGRKLSQKTKDKISIALMGNHYSSGKKNRLGIKHTPEACEKMRMAACNRTLETRAKMRIAALGNKNALGCKRSLETRVKIAASAMGNKRCLGRIATPATLFKMSESAKLWWKNHRISLP